MIMVPFRLNQSAAPQPTQKRINKVVAKLCATLLLLDATDKLFLSNLTAGGHTA
ncbi:MAG: hypothetical protein ACJAZM_001275 [Cyclobacteriaceae bacterium]|jgi:hypothetical protein